MCGRIVLRSARLRDLTSAGLGSLYVAIVAVVAFTAPGSLPRGIGLDPSWIIGLGEASNRHLVFGRDIAFTYGPLGYLIPSIANRGDFTAMTALQLAVAVLIAATIVDRLREPVSLYQKILLAVFFPLILACSSTDSWPPLLALLLLTKRARERGHEPIVMMGLGLFAGIFTLTKFTAGVDVMLPVMAYVGAGLYELRSDAPRRLRLMHAALCFAYGLLAASAASFICIDYGTTATVLIESTALFLAAASIGLRRFVVVRDPWLLVAAASSFGIVAASAALSPTYRDYVASSAKIMLGYSAGEALAGPLWQIEVAVLLMAAIAVVALFGRQRTSIAPMLALLTYEWTVFKLGFVRQDAHVLYFFDGTVLVALILVYAANSRRNALAPGVVFVATLAILQATHEVIGLPSVIAAFSPTRIVEHIRLLATLPQHAEEIDEADETALASERLPRSVVRSIGDRPVEVIPTEIGLAVGNRLNWTPQPVLQDYLAFSPALDEMNLENLERRRNDAILLSYGSIDDRFPMGDEPATFRYVLCHYTTATDASQKGLDPIIVLFRAHATRCSENGSIATRPAPWNTPIVVPHRPGLLTFARIDTEPNFAGRALTFAFRGPIASAIVRFDDGRSGTYRLVAANGPDGLLVNPVPRNPRDLEALFAGRLPSRVHSITLSAKTRWFETPSISFFFMKFDAKMFASSI